MGLGYDKQRTNAVTAAPSFTSDCGPTDYGSNEDRQADVRASVPATDRSTGPASGEDLGSPDWARELDEHLLQPAPTSGISAAPAAPDLAQLLDSLGKQSPALSSAIAAARGAGFVFQYGTPGAGTFTNSTASPPAVMIDPRDASSPLLASTLAHELGHATHGKPTYVFDASMDRTRYITENTIIDLEGEAAATLMELRVRDDVMRGGGADPGVTGATASDKIRLWNEHKGGALTHDQLVHEIVLLFARVEKPSTDAKAATYWAFYAKNHAAAWDANNPTATPLPLPSPP